MIQIYTDDVLTFDSRLEEYNLLGLSVQLGLNKGGTAEIIMPPEHPAHSSFTSYKSIVEIRRDAELLFRGRALSPADDFYNRRTITCEGELCFFRDSVMRPYLYQDDPASIFTALVTNHNAQVEEAKRFVVGTITVTDPNDYIRMESEKAEQTSDTLNTLLERCGGYIVFTTNSSGQRVVNWYKSLGYRSTQLIEFGENLLDFARTESNADLATAILPYGAADDTGTRVTIKSVNGGVDYVQDEQAVALRGFIMQPVYWDDVTEPANLLTKAQQYLASSKQILTSLSLSAVDLSLVDANLDQFQIGDDIHVVSKPHSVDAWFQLTQLDLDLLNPEKDKVTLGSTVASLTGATVDSARGLQSSVVSTVRQTMSGYDADTTAAIQAAVASMTSLINQTRDEIQLMVEEKYATGDEVTGAISTQITQLSDSITFQFNQLSSAIDGNDAEARRQFTELRQYIRFEAGNIILGETGNEITLRIENDRVSFLDAGAEVAYFSDKQLHVLDGRFLNSLRIGAFAWIPRANGNLSLVKVGD